MDSMSRWFVGSSISSTSGRPSSTRASATRIFQPPESAPTSPSIWSSASRARAAPRAPAPRACSRPGARTLPAPRRSGRGSGPSRRRAPGLPSPAAALRARDADRRRRPLPAMASSSTERPCHLLHVLAEVADGELLRDGDLAFVRRPLRRRSCGRAWSCPRRSGRPGPTFSPGFNWKEASTKMSCLPYCLLMFESEIMWCREPEETIAGDSPLGYQRGGDRAARATEPGRDARRAAHSPTRRA